MPDGLAKPARWWPGIRAGHPLARDLVGCWPFWEGQGGNAYDVASPFDIANHGTLTNGPTWEAGTMGSVIRTNGTQQYVTMGTSAALQPTSCTVMIVATYDEVTQTDNNAALVHHINGESKGFELVVRESDNKLWWATTNDFAINPTSFAAISGVRFVAVLVSDEATGVRVYANGQLVDSNAGATGPLTYTAGSQFVVGARVDSSSLDPAIDIDFAAIGSRALAPSQVAELSYDPYALIRPRAKTYLYATGGAPAAGNRRRRLLIAG